MAETAVRRRSLALDLSGARLGVGVPVAVLLASEAAQVHVDHGAFADRAVRGAEHEARSLALAAARTTTRMTRFESSIASTCALANERSSEPLERRFWSLSDHSCSRSKAGSRGVIQPS